MVRKNVIPARWRQKERRGKKFLFLKTGGITSKTEGWEMVNKQKYEEKKL